MHNRRGGRLRTASLALMACTAVFGCGFFLGKMVGVNESRSTPLSMATRPTLNTVSKAASSGSSSGSSSDLARPLSWPPEGSSENTAPICFDSCPKARNGVCDEGRLPESQGSHSLVLCDLGTDCEDCGPWIPSTQDVAWRQSGQGGPISRLLEREVEVRVRRTTLSPFKFLFAYTDPHKDVDVSAHMQGRGSVEEENSLVFYKIFSQGCRRPDGSRALFIDVGANFGWFSVMAAVLGCRVLSFEPVPHFHAFLEYNLHVNRLAHLVDVRRLVVSAEAGVSLNMTVPSHGVWGTAGIGGHNIDHNIKGSLEIISVPSVRLDQLVKQEALLMKMDVEGWEFSVFAGARKVIESYGIDNIIMEYSPGVPERNFRFPELEQTILMLGDILKYQYKVAHIQDGGVKVFRDTAVEMSQDLPTMKEVTPHNIKYELADLAKFKVGRLGCALGSGPDTLEVGRHKALDTLNHQAWFGCNAIPEDLSPRSLRSVMGHNTNLWASRKPEMLMKLDGPVGLLPVMAPVTQYFAEDGAIWGLGRRLCKDIPANMQVRHRCRCLDSSTCGKEEEEILKLTQQGDGVIPSNYILPPP